MTKNGKLIALLVVGGLLVWGYRARNGERGDDGTIRDDRSEVVNRVWIDKIPEDMRDKLDIFVAQGDPRFGVFQRTSAYEGDYTVFQWHAHRKGRLHITMLQTGKDHQLGTKVSRKGCKQFDLCMELTGAPRGAKKYYSMKDWVIDAHASEPGAIRAFIRTKLLKAK